MTLNKLGDRVRRRRQVRHLRQCELAEAIGLSRSALCHIEKNQSLPSCEILLKLSRYLKVSSHYLLCGRRR